MEPATRYTEYDVRRRAFELWKRHGRREGHEVEFWLQAERELKSEKAAANA